MKYRAACISVVAALLSASLLLAVSKESRFHLKCDSLALTSRLDRHWILDVPPSKVKDFNTRLITFLHSHGYAYETSSTNDYLSPPDAEGRQNPFLSTKTIGCNFGTILWSENIRGATQFDVTIYKTWFGTNGRVTQFASDFEREFMDFEKRLSN